MPPKFTNHANTPRYVCGSFTTEVQRRKITPDHQKFYQL